MTRARRAPARARRVAGLAVVAALVLMVVVPTAAGAKDTYSGKTKTGDVLVGVFVGGKTSEGRPVGVVLCDPNAFDAPSPSTAFRPYATLFQITQTSFFEGGTAKLITDGGSRVTARLLPHRVRGTVRMSDGRRLRFDIPRGDYAARIGNRCGNVPTSMPPTPCGPRTPGPAVEVVAVTVPCGCPSLPVTPAPAGDEAHAEATAAATRYLHERLPQFWGESNTVVDDVYDVLGTTNAKSGDFGGVFEFTATAYCDDNLAAASYGVELHSTVPGPAGSGIRAALVVAHFDVGWRVWGVYKGPVSNPNAS